VRQTTDHDSWSWDYHLDYLNASLSRDYANAGLATSGSPRGGVQAATVGLSFRVHDWAGAATASEQSAPLVDANVTAPDGSVVGVDATTLRARFALARWIPQLDLAVGVDLQLAVLSLNPACPSSEQCSSLFGIAGVGAQAGATWIPRDQDVRLGVVASSPISGGGVTATACDPENCEGYILPQQVHVPWQVAVGGALRLADTAWNQIVPTTFRDERSLTLASDVVITGTSPNGYGLQAFGMHLLEPCGRDVSWSLHGGAEYEWLPGRLRVRAGSYWEPGRCEGVSGRLHGTFGIEVRTLEFHLWGLRRGRITVTGDVASRYDNLAVSIGFWH
jgi:hypothetical protein